LIKLTPISCENSAKLSSNPSEFGSEDDKNHLSLKLMNNFSKRKDFQPKKVSDFAKNDCRSRGKTVNEKYDKKKEEKEHCFNTKNSKQENSLFNKMIKQKLMKEMEKKTWLKDISLQLSIEHGSEKFEERGFFSDKKPNGRKESVEEGFVDIFSDIFLNSENSEISDHNSPVYHRRKETKKTFNFETLNLEYCESMDNSVSSKHSLQQPLLTENEQTVKEDGKDEINENYKNGDENEEEKEKLENEKNEEEAALVRRMKKGKTMLEETNLVINRSSMQKSIRMEKKDIIRKDDEGIKICNKIEEKLREVSENEYTIGSNLKLESIIKYLQELKNLIYNGNIEGTSHQPYEYYEIEEILEFMKKFLNIGEKYLNYKHLANQNLLRNDRGCVKKEFFRGWKKTKTVKSKQNSFSLEKTRKSRTPNPNLVSFKRQKTRTEIIKPMEIDTNPLKKPNKNLTLLTKFEKTDEIWLNNEDKTKELSNKLRLSIKVEQKPIKSILSADEKAKKKVSFNEEEGRENMTKITLIKPTDFECMNVKGIASPGIFQQNSKKRPSIITRFLECGQFFTDENARILDKNTKEIRHSPIFKYTKRKSVEVLSPDRKSPERHLKRSKRPRQSAMGILRGGGTLPLDIIENYDKFPRKKARHYSYQIPRKVPIEEPLNRNHEKEDKKEEKNEEKMEKMNEVANEKNEVADRIEEEDTDSSEDSISMIDVKDYMRDYYSDSDVVKFSKTMECEFGM